MVHDSLLDTHKYVEVTDAKYNTHAYGQSVGVGLPYLVMNIYRFYYIIRDTW